MSIYKDFCYKFGYLNTILGYHIILEPNLIFTESKMLLIMRCTVILHDTRKIKQPIGLK